MPEQEVLPPGTPTDEERASMDRELDVTDAKWGSLARAAFDMLASQSVFMSNGIDIANGKMLRRERVHDAEYIDFNPIEHRIPIPRNLHDRGEFIDMYSPFSFNKKKRPPRGPMLTKPATIDSRKASKLARKRTKRGR